MTAPLVAHDFRYPRDRPRVEVDGFRLHPEERLVLFGPNGAGKSTLLRLLAGVLPGGPRVEVAYLPQRPWMFRGWAGDNLGLGLDAEHAALARQIADQLGLTDLAKPAPQLSGGEAQRLALARVLARPEPLLLLDEPLAPIDLRDRVHVAEVVSEWIGARAAVIVTHDQQHAAALGDTMGVMLEGNLVQRGPVADVFGQPIDGSVAEVLGIGNVVEGEVVEAANGLVAVQLGEVIVWGIGEAPRGHRARALFGAEAVTVLASGSPSGSARNHWVGVIRSLGSQGRLVELAVDVGYPIVALVTPGAADSMELTVGMEVVVAVKATAVRAVAV